MGKRSRGKGRHDGTHPNPKGRHHGRRGESDLKKREKLEHLERLEREWRRASVELRDVGPRRGRDGQNAVHDPTRNGRVPEDTAHDDPGSESD
jgi:hypothetical protein